jgi:hypothetical protein
MSLDKDIFAAMGVPVLMERGGEPISYTVPDGGAAVSLTAIVGAERTEDRKIESGDMVKRKLVKVTIHTDPLSEWGGVADPQLGATVCIGDITYAVDAVASRIGQVAVLDLIRTRPREVSRKGYRQG